MGFTEIECLSWRHPHRLISTVRKFRSELYNKNTRIYKQRADGKLIRLFGGGWK